MNVLVYASLSLEIFAPIQEVRRIFEDKNYTFFKPEVIQPFSLKGENDCIWCKICCVESGWKASLMNADDEGWQVEFLSTLYSYGSLSFSWPSQVY